MRRQLVSAGLAVALAMPLAGCFTVSHYVEDSPSPIEVTSGQGGQRYHFKEEGRYYYLLYGLWPVSSPKMDEMLGKHMIKGTKISHLKIKQEFGGWDFLVDWAVWLGTGAISMGVLPALLGFYTRTVSYEGDVVNDQDAQ